MSITQRFTTDESIELDEFVDYALSNVNTSSSEGLLALGEKFTMLGNNRTFLSDFFADYIKENFVRDPLSQIVSQSVVLARNESFYVRANFWLPEDDMTESETFLFAYHQAHDHNFDLLSLAYCGDGYMTDGYTYDYNKVAGYVGEVVDIEPLGSHHHAYGEVLLYECNKDIHIQRPPSEPSITLNVIPLVNQNGLLDQYFFDIDRIDSTQGTIQRYGNNIMEQRKDLFAIVKHLANDEIAQLFIDIAKSHPCKRTRFEAIRSLKVYSKEMHDQLCYMLRDDKTAIVKHYVDTVLTA